MGFIIKFSVIPEHFMISLCFKSQIILELKIKFKIKRWQHRCQDPSPSRPPPHALWGEQLHHNHLIFMTNVINLLVFCLKIQLFAFFIGHPPNPLWPGVRNKSQWTKSQIMMNLFCPTHHRKIFCEVTSSPFYEVPIYLFFRPYLKEEKNSWSLKDTYQIKTMCCYHNNEPGEIPNYHLGFCSLGFIPTTFDLIKRAIFSSPVCSRRR